MVDLDLNIHQLGHYFDNPMEGALIGGAFGGIGDHLQMWKDLFTDSKDFGHDLLKALFVEGTLIGSFLLASGLLQSGPDNYILAAEISLLVSGAVQSTFKEGFTKGLFFSGFAIGLGLGTVVEVLQSIFPEIAKELPSPKGLNDLLGRGANYFVEAFKVASKFKMPVLPN